MHTHTCACICINIQLYADVYMYIYNIMYMYISIHSSHNQAPMRPSITKYYQNMVTWNRIPLEVTQVVHNDPWVALNPGTRVQKTSHDKPQM